MLLNFDNSIIVVHWSFFSRKAIEIYWGFASEKRLKLLQEEGTIVASTGIDFLLYSCYNTYRKFTADQYAV